MARFETWADVARLFFGAACVGVILVLFLTAEAKNIEEREEALVGEKEEKVVAEAGDISPLSGFRTVWSKLSHFIRLLVRTMCINVSEHIVTPRYSRDDTSEEVGRRKKREISSEEDYYSFPIREDQEEEISSDQVTGNGPSEEISQSSDQLTNGLSSALLTSALDGHKVNTTV